MNSHSQATIITLEVTINRDLEDNDTESTKTKVPTIDREEEEVVATSEGEVAFKADKVVISTMEVANETNPLPMERISVRVAIRKEATTASAVECKAEEADTRRAEERNRAPHKVATLETPKDMVM
jgi:hypothetical protein